MDLLTNVKFMVTTSYGVLSMLIYSGITCVIINDHKTFKSSFFKLFCVGFFMNLCTYLNSFVTLRIPQNTGVQGTFSSFYSNLNLNNTENWFPLNIFHTFHFEFAYTQYIFNCFVCANRFTAICFPIRSEKYWLKYLWLVIMSMFLIPFIFFTRHILQNRSFFGYSSTANFYIDTTYGRSNIYYFLMPALIFLTCFNIVFNVLAGIRLYNMKKKGVKVPETSLFSMAFTVFVIDLFLTSLTVSNYYLTNLAIGSDSDFVKFLLRWIPLLTPFASDALTLTHPFLLLYFSKTVRRKCAESNRLLEKFKNHRFFAESNSNIVVMSLPKNLNTMAPNS
ncbi:Serpentine receptor class gamma [Caenorhabditis elegans]|uniref:Serpentine receptor class gamma n=1 Tax=Caenorhabditis elegans TaxID=6239 RepID=Q9XXQ5_CAEEL|nr:Serpentine receptor class gamma [Caenorhabditis elegans]CAA16409.1 Serpentine receptor class gamma [Caenorhabditis elegans]|eukprot:NP_507631.1 Serpentine receptor class gamma [Caenorhabditis elegans]